MNEPVELSIPAIIEKSGQFSKCDFLKLEASEGFLQCCEFGLSNFIIYTKGLFNDYEATACSMSMTQSCIQAFDIVFLFLVSQTAAHLSQTRDFLRPADVSAFHPIRVQLHFSFHGSLYKKMQQLFFL